VLVGV